MGSKWRKIKLALGFNPRNRFSNNNDTELPLDAGVVSPPGDWKSAPATPVSNKGKLSKSLSRSSSSKKICSICLASMRRGDGQAIFTAECSHSFHFHCIASNVKHGNQICPVCRAKWKEIPAKRPTLVLPPGRARINPLDLAQNDNVIALMPRLTPRLNSSRNIAAPSLHSPEPVVYNDDESLDRQIDSSSILNERSADCDGQRRVIIKTYTEVSAVLHSRELDSLTVLLHVKAPSSNLQNPSKSDTMLPALTQTPRAAVDLVTVLDISGSMAGTKLALLKRAMGFVIQNLSPNDRLAVIAFSSTARRLFPLRRMSETGRQQALQAVNSLVASGGTNIAEGLRKGAKIMEDRREKNPVASIILLSDGQDTYTLNSTGGTQRQKSNYEQLLPLSVRREETSSCTIPVHAFGFGVDHDASSMHSISEISGGTFSFIETEGVIQDAFAQCIGGLLSVVVKDLQLRVESVDSRIHLSWLRSGSYPNRISSDQRTGFINVGDLYADEERDFLVSLNVPVEKNSRNNTSLLAVKCVYNDSLSKESVTIECEEVKIIRSEKMGQEHVSIEVDRQKNRINAAEAMARASTAAENGDLAAAVSILENCRKTLSETVSAKANDNLCVALDSELKEMQDRMANRRMYEESGRAYILSGLSSHSWQRATARGDSTGGSSLSQSYQTPSMVEMVTRSQATLLGGHSAQRLLRPLSQGSGGRKMKL